MLDSVPTFIKKLISIDKDKEQSVKGRWCIYIWEEALNVDAMLHVTKKKNWQQKYNSIIFHDDINVHVILD